MATSVEVKTIASLIDGCDRVLSNLEGATAKRVCEDIEHLDHLHDRLAKEVENLAGLLRDTLVAMRSAEPMTSDQITTKVKTETADVVARLCEVTDKASRELDASVHKIVTGLNAYPNSVYAWEFIQNRKVHRLPLYTESVDAALKLIPSGYDIAELKSSPSGCAVRLWIPSNPACGYGRHCTGATKALAICAAALRAIKT